MKEQVPERVKLDRRRRLLSAQRDVAARVWGRWVGREVPVRIDVEASGRAGGWIGRVEQQGYEVDGTTKIRNSASGATPAAPRVGDRVAVRIQAVHGYDLEGALA
jgi:tRNA A37 methylthiotransferase MiaB